MLRELGRGIQKFGYGVRVVGAFCLCLAAIIGTAAIDLVLLVAIFRHGGRQNNFLTGFLLGSLFFRSNPTYERSASLMTLFIASIITSMIAIFLAVFFAVPMVGAFIALAWTVAFATTGVGLLLEKLGGEMIDRADAPAVPVVEAVPVSTPASPVPPRAPSYDDVRPYPTVGVPFRASYASSRAAYTAYTTDGVQHSRQGATPFTRGGRGIPVPTDWNTHSRGGVRHSRQGAEPSIRVVKTSPHL